MHIVLVSPAWPPLHFASGIVTYVNNLRAELLARGNRVTILVLDSSFEETSSVEVLPVRATLLFRLQARLMRLIGRAEWPTEHWGRMVAATLLKLHRQLPIDVVEMEESFGWCGAVSARTRLPVVVKLHGPTFLVSPVDLNPDKSLARRIRNEGDALSRINTIISPSRCTLDDTLGRYSLKPNYAKQVVNSLVDRPDLPIWSKSSCEQSVVLFVGRFDIVKGADTLLKAFKILLSQDPTRTLLFAGPDRGLMDEDGRFWQAQAYIDHLYEPQQRGQVHFLGQQSSAQLEALRIRSGVTVMASRWENQPYTLLEAMLQGCPVVASNSGGSGEIVVNGQNGLLFESANPVSLATALQEVIADFGWAAEMGRKARKYVLEAHSPAVVADETLLAYAHAVAVA